MSISHFSGKALRAGGVQLWIGRVPVHATAQSLHVWSNRPAEGLASLTFEVRVSSRPPVVGALRRFRLCVAEFLYRGRCVVSAVSGLDVVYQTVGIFTVGQAQGGRDGK